MSLVVFCSTDAHVFLFAERCGAERSRYVDGLLALFAALCFVSWQAVCPVPVPGELSPAQFAQTVMLVWENLSDLILWKVNNGFFMRGGVGGSDSFLPLLCHVW